MNRSQIKDYIQSNTGKLVIIATAKWCEPCKKSKPFIEECLTQYNVNYLYIDYDEDDRSYLRIKSIPTLLYFQNNELQECCISSQKRDIFSFFEKMQ